MVEMDYILGLWLGEVPIYTATFCRFILATFLVDRLSSGNMIAISAHGRIAAFQATIGTCHVLTLPLAWFFLKLGATPTSVGVAFITTTFVVSAGRVFWLRRLLGVSARHWFSTVVLTSSTVALAGFSAILVPYLLLPQSFLRLVIVAFVGLTAILLSTWFFALDENEQRFVKINATRLLDKMIHKRLHL